MESDIVVLHEALTLPLYHLPYNVIVGYTMKEMVAHLGVLYPGVNMEISNAVMGYCCIVKHPTLGENLVLMLSVLDGLGLPPLLSTIVHECTNLSWYILDELGIEVDADSHATQSYIIEELVMQVTNIVENFKHFPTENPDGSIDKL